MLKFAIVEYELTNGETRKASCVGLSFEDIIGFIRRISGTNFKKLIGINYDKEINGFTDASIDYIKQKTGKPQKSQKVSNETLQQDVKEVNKEIVKESVKESVKEGEFTCEICGKSFKSETGLKIHKAREHKQPVKTV